MKIARKFTLALVAGILVVLAASMVLRVKREQALFELDIARDSLVLGRALGHAVERTWENRGQEQALEIIEYATKQESHLQMRWVWLDAAKENLNATALPHDLLEALSRGESVVVPLEKGASAIHTYVPVSVSDHRVGAIEILDPLVEEQAYLKGSILNASITAFVLVTLCGLVTWLLGVALIGRPMRGLVEHARAIGRGELGRRLSLVGKDEIGQLASEMDAMSQSLREAHDRLQEETRSRIEAIEQLRHADRLATVGTLASGIAHELGTPISVIEGYAQLIREDSAAGRRAKDAAVIIRRQCERMTQIIRQLLDFARQGGPRNGSTDVHEVVRETFRMVEPLIRKQDVEASVEELATNLRVGVSFHQMQQVVANIMLNALHAMPEGGQLVVGTGRRRAKHPHKQGDQADFVTVSIRDTGLGMDEETAARVFEPFFTTKDVGEGTGLGLSVACGIIESHGGWIEVRSAPRCGSTFVIFLPSEQYQ